MVTASAVAADAVAIAVEVVDVVADHTYGAADVGGAVASAGKAVDIARDGYAGTGIVRSHCGVSLVPTRTTFVTGCVVISDLINFFVVSTPSITVTSYVRVLTPDTPRVRTFLVPLARDESLTVLVLCGTFSVTVMVRVCVTGVGDCVGVACCEGVGAAAVVGSSEVCSAWTDGTASGGEARRPEESEDGATIAEIVATPQHRSTRATAPTSTIISGFVRFGGCAPQPPLLAGKTPVGYGAVPPWPGGGTCGEGAGGEGCHCPGVLWRLVGHSPSLLSRAGSLTGRSGTLYVDPSTGPPYDRRSLSAALHRTLDGRLSMSAERRRCAPDGGRASVRGVASVAASATECGQQT